MPPRYTQEEKDYILTQRAAKASYEEIANGLNEFSEHKQSYINVKQCFYQLVKRATPLDGGKPKPIQRRLPPSKCLDCARATRGNTLRVSAEWCSWAKSFAPVEGWTAEECIIKPQTKQGCEIQTYCVTRCPLFVADYIRGNDSDECVKIC